MARERYRSDPGVPAGLGCIAVDHVDHVGGLEAERWIFLYDERRCILILDAYYQLRRPTKRHRWDIISLYGRVPLVGEPPTLSKEIREEALAEFVKGIKVCTQKELEK